MSSIYNKERYRYAADPERLHKAHHGPGHSWRLPAGRRRPHRRHRSPHRPAGGLHRHRCRRPPADPRLCGGPLPHRPGQRVPALGGHGLQRGGGASDPPAAGHRLHQSPGRGIPQRTPRRRHHRLHRPRQCQRGGRHLHGAEAGRQAGGQYAAEGACRHEVRLRRESQGLLRSGHEEKPHDPHGRGGAAA